MRSHKWYCPDCVVMYQSKQSIKQYTCKCGKAMKPMPPNKQTCFFIAVTPDDKPQIVRKNKNNGDYIQSIKHNYSNYLKCVNKKEYDIVKITGEYYHVITSKHKLWCIQGFNIQTNKKTNVYPLSYALWALCKNKNDFDFKQRPNPRQNPNKYRLRATKKKYKAKYQKLQQIVHSKDGYSWYLTTKHWQKFRKRALEYYGYRCGLCGTDQGLQVHHLHYKTLFRESFKDVKVLCGCCHAEQHGYEGLSELDKENLKHLKNIMTE